MDRDDDALAAEYALGVLPHAERVAFAARLETSDALRERVRFWDEALVPMSAQVEDVAPPAPVLAGIDERLFGAPERPGWWSSLGFWRGLSFAAIAGALLLGAVTADLIRLPYRAEQPQPTFVAELSGETGEVRLVALYDADAGHLRLNRAEGDPASGRDLELWLIEGGEPPLSLGVLPADREGTVAVTADLVARFDGGVLAITDEPAGGAPGGQPTGPVVASGELTSI